MDLETIEAIRALKYRYLRTLDLKRWDEFGACFTEDATASYSGGQYEFTRPRRHRGVHAGVARSDHDHHAPVPSSRDRRRGRSRPAAPGRCRTR